VGIIFASIVAVIRTISESSIRRRMIERGEVNEKTRVIIMGHAELRALSSLKWGMVLVGVGLAAMVSHWWPYYWSDEGAFGLMLIFAGLGFLIYYPLAQKRLKDLERREQHNTGSAT
jgi:phosphatidylglycerophosphate synthase